MHSTEQEMNYFFMHTIDFIIQTHEILTVERNITVLCTHSCCVMHDMDWYGGEKKSDGFL